MPPTSPTTSTARLCSIAIAIAALLLATTLAACGSSHKGGAAAHSAATTGSDPTTSAATTSPAPPAQDSAKPVATVAGKPISFASLEHWMAIEAISKAKVPDPPSYTKCIARLASASGSASASGPKSAGLKAACQKRYEELQQEALGSLIQTQWLTDEAAESGLKIDQGALQHEYSQSLASNGASLRAQLAATGETLAELKQGLVLQQLSDDLYERVKRATPKLTHAMIARYYQQHKATYAKPELRDLKIVRTQTAAAAERARQQIASGQSFASVAREVSTVPQPIASHEGLLNGLAPKFFSEPVLARAIFAARPRVLTGPVHISLGYYVFEVLRIHPPRQQSLSQVEASIKAQLSEQLHLKTLTSMVKAFKAKWRARTDCAPGYVAPSCPGYKGAAVEDPYNF